MHRTLGPDSPKLVVKEKTEPTYVEQARAQLQQGRRNSEWLAAHWAELLPRIRGRHVAVAGEEAFVADSPEEAWAMAKAAHPDDNGAIMQFVFAETHPRIYANRG
jgi:hypothetical protein